jgi:hypothetical protein
MSRVIANRRTTRRAEAIVDAVFGELCGRLNFTIDPAAASNRVLREKCVERVAALLEDGATP